MKYYIFECIPDKCHITSGIRSLIHIYKGLLCRPSFEPVLMLEDDVNITDAYINNIEIPNNADCVYLGLSNCFVPYGDRPSVPWANVENSNLVKIADMLSTHSYLICSEKWIRVLLECMEKILHNVNSDGHNLHRCIEYDYFHAEQDQH